MSRPSPPPRQLWRDAAFETDLNNVLAAEALNRERRSLLCEVPGNSP